MGDTKTQTKEDAEGETLRAFLTERYKAWREAKQRDSKPVKHDDVVPTLPGLALRCQDPPPMDTQKIISEKDANNDNDNSNNNSNNNNRGNATRKAPTRSLKGARLRVQSARPPVSTRSGLSTFQDTVIEGDIQAERVRCALRTMLARGANGVQDELNAHARGALRPGIASWMLTREPRVRLQRRRLDLQDKLFTSCRGPFPPPLPSFRESVFSRPASPGERSSYVTDTSRRSLYTLLGTSKSAGAKRKEPKPPLKLREPKLQLFKEFKEHKEQSKPKTRKERPSTVHGTQIRITERGSRKPFYPPNSTPGSKARRATSSKASKASSKATAPQCERIPSALPARAVGRAMTAHPANRDVVTIGLLRSGSAPPEPCRPSLASGFCHTPGPPTVVFGPSISGHLSRMPSLFLPVAPPFVPTLRNIPTRLPQTFPLLPRRTPTPHERQLILDARTRALACRRAGCVRDLGETLVCRAVLHENLGSLDRARECYKAALTCAQIVEDEALQASLYGAMGYLYHLAFLRRVTEREAPAENQPLPGRGATSVVTTRGGWGRGWCSDGQPDDFLAASLRLHNQALAHSHDPLFCFAPHFNLGLVFAALDDIQRADSHFQKAMACIEHPGTRQFSVACALVNGDRGLLAAFSHRPAEAIAPLRKYLDAARSLHDVSVAAMTSYLLGSILDRLGQYDESVEILNQAISMGKECTSTEIVDSARCLVGAVIGRKRLKDMIAEQRKKV